MLLRRLRPVYSVYFRVKIIVNVLNWKLIGRKIFVWNRIYSQKYFIGKHIVEQIFFKILFGRTVFLILNSSNPIIFYEVKFQRNSMFPKKISDNLGQNVQ